MGATITAGLSVRYIEIIARVDGKKELRAHDDDTVLYMQEGDQIEFTVDDEQIEKRKLKIIVKIVSLEEEFEDGS